MTEAEKQQDLEALQDAIYRDKVQRARGMTEQQRFETVFELTDEVMERMLAGAMWQLGTANRKEGEAELVRRIGRLRRVRDLDRIGPEPRPATIA